MKTSLKTQLTDGLLNQLSKRTRQERQEIGEAIKLVSESWGHPHKHSGIGIRRLTKTIFECRVGLDDRLTFTFKASPAALVFFFLGNHDEIKALIRSL